MDIIFHITAVKDNDLDPVCQILKNRATAMRRAIAKKRQRKAPIQKPRDRDNLMVDTREDGEIREESEANGPAPHPSHASRYGWLRKTKPLGPTG